VTRRDLVVLLGSVAVFPFAAHATKKNPGSVGLPVEAGQHGRTCLKGLRELWLCRRTQLLWRWARLREQERLPILAAELERPDVDVLVASISAGVPAAVDAYRTIPIVMVGGGNPADRR